MKLLQLLLIAILPAIVAFHIGKQQSEVKTVEKVVTKVVEKSVYSLGDGLTCICIDNECECKRL